MTQTADIELIRKFDEDYGMPVITNAGIYTRAINNLYLFNIVARVREQIAADIEARRDPFPYSPYHQGRDIGLEVAARIARGESWLTT